MARLPPAERRPRLRGGRAPREFHPGRGRARDDPGRGLLSNSLVRRAAWRAPVRAHQGPGLADRRRPPDRAAGRHRVRDARGRLFRAGRRRSGPALAQHGADAWPRPGWRRGSAPSRSAIPISRCACRSDNRLVDFSTGEFHAAIRVGRGDWPGLSCHFLFRMNFSPICSAEFAAAHQLSRPGAIARRAAAQPARRLVARLAARDAGVDGPATGARFRASSSTIR